MLSFDLRLKSTDMPLLEITKTSPAAAAAGEVDGARPGRFLLATLTFIGQPRMAERVEHPARVTAPARVARSKFGILFVLCSGLLDSFIPPQALTDPNDSICSRTDTKGRARRWHFSDRFPILCDRFLVRFR
jgi:hypothetical protein